MAYYDPYSTQGLVEDIVKDVFSEDTPLQDKESKFKTLDLGKFIHAYTKMGNITSSVADTLFGIKNAITNNNMGIQKQANMKSLVFFTRPQLNLRSRYLIQDRKMADLLTEDLMTPGAHVRNLLDPRLAIHGDVDSRVVDSPLTDKHNCFIPVLTNQYKGMTGWQSTTSPTRTSSPGIQKEEVVMVDGTTEFRGRYELDITFGKMPGGIIKKLMTTWVRYPSLTYQGILQPYYDFIRGDEADYHTRIYKLIMTSDGNHVAEIASSGYSFPISIPDGEEFNDTYDDSSAPYTSMDDNTYRFVCVGSIINDPVTILNFNLSTTYFHPGMKLLNQGRLGHGMVKLNDELKEYLSGKSYPRIDLFTLELEWWAETDRVNLAIEKLKGEESANDEWNLAELYPRVNGGHVVAGSTTKVPTGEKDVLDIIPAVIDLGIQTLTNTGDDTDLGIKITSPISNDAEWDLF